MRKDQNLPEFSDPNLGFRPFKGPQVEFLSCSALEVLHVGGRGSAKSEALIADPLDCLHIPEWKGILLRKERKHLNDLIERAKKLFGKFFGVDGETLWRNSEKKFVFPSGAILYCGYFEDERHLDQYIGQEYHWIGIDEVNQIANDAIYEDLIQSVRTTLKHIPLRIRLTGNPSGSGWVWVRQRFVVGVDRERVEYIDDNGDPRFYTRGEQSESFLGDGGIIRTRRRVFIVSTVLNNPILVKTDYMAGLQAIKSERRRKQWLEGNLDVLEGTAFDEFDKDIHVCKPFEIPASWPRWRACDWGYATMAAVLWFARSPDGKFYTYREMTTSRVGSEKLGKKILKAEQGEKITWAVLDAKAWNKVDGNSRPPALTMNQMGCRWQMAINKDPNTRKLTKQLVHEALELDENDSPQWYIFNTCKELIDNLMMLPVNPNDPEDVLKKGQKDHAYDAARYYWARLSPKDRYASRPHTSKRHKQKTPVRIPGSCKF